MSQVSCEGGGSRKEDGERGTGGQWSRLARMFKSGICISLLCISGIFLSHRYNGDSGNENNDTCLKESKVKEVYMLRKKEKRDESVAV